jgi:diaminopimelate decarboxylase
MIKSRRDLLTSFDKELLISSIIKDTPYYLFSERVLLRNLENIRNGFSKYWENTQVAYSYKTNPLVAICNFFADFGVWGEVTSDYELDIAESIGVKKIVFNGVYKTVDEMRRAIEMNALVNIDGWTQLEGIIDLSREFSREIKIGLRVRPSKYVQSSWDKFGFEYKTMDKVFERIKAFSNIRIVGLHIHISTNEGEYGKYYRAAKFIGQIFQNTIDPIAIGDEYIDLGGGFSSSLSKRHFENYAKAITQGLMESGVSKKVLLIIEPGRSLVETAGLAVSKVVDIRDGKRSNNYLVLDAGVNTVMGVDLVGSRIVLLYQDPKTKNKTIYDVFGPLCAQRDILAEKIHLFQVEIGDIIILPNIGAYDISTAYPFIRLRPPVYKVDISGNLKLIRRQELTTDVLRLEVDND